jgi:PAS domain S-box-containing protein
MSTDPAVRINSLLDGVSDAFLALDAEWRVTYANREAARLNDATPDALLGRSHWEIWPETVGTEVERRYRRVVAERAPAHFEHFYPLSGLWHEVSAYPADDGGIAIFYRDVTARRRADRAARLFAEVGAMLTSSLDETARHRALARALVPALGDWCIIDLIEPDGSARRAAYAHGNPAMEATLRELAERFPPELRRPTLSRDVLANHAAQLRSDVPDAFIDEMVRSPEQARLVRALGMRSTIVVPLLLRDRLLGVIALVSANRRFDETDLALAEELSRRGALAMDNARAYAAALAARELAEAARGRLGFLSDASAALASSLDYATTLQTVAHLAVPAVADWCMVDVLEGERAVRRVAVAHANPALADVARRFHRILHHHRADGHGISVAIETGRTAVVDGVTDAVLQKIARDDEHLELLRALDMRAYVTVPLIARGHTLGAVSFVASPDRPPYGPEDVEAFEELARRAAVAIDNARLFTESERARDRTARLQAATAALAGAVTVGAVADVIVEQAAAALGATAGALSLLDPDGAAMRTEGARGYPDGAIDAWRHFPTSTASPVTDAARRGEPVYLESRDQWRSRYPAATDAAVGGEFNAWIAVPMRVDGRSLGALALSFAAPRTFDAGDRAFAEALAAQCGLAVERAWAFASERDARAEAEEARQRAEQASRAKSEFLAVMSHELRTPLNAIGGYAELIEMGIRGPVTEQQREDLARIQKSQKHLLGLINEVLNYARVESGAVRYELGPVDVGEVVASVEPLVMPQLGAKALAYEVERGEPGLVVIADRDKLRQVLLNLLSNAIKFTDRGGRVALRWERDGDLVLLHIADTGIGIPTDKRSAIFEPFVQVDSRLTRETGGTGLGLAISRDLARGMGGELTAESEVGVGSTFTLVLPSGERRVVSGE